MVCIKSSIEPVVGVVEFYGLGGRGRWWVPGKEFIRSFFCGMAWQVCCLFWPFRGHARSHWDPTRFRVCANPVGAGVPAKRPEQATNKPGYFLSLANAASSAWLMVRNTFTRAQRLSLASTSVHGAISVLVRSTMSPTAWT